LVINSDVVVRVLTLCVVELGVEPSFDVAVVNVTVVVGQTAVLPCSIEHLANFKVSPHCCSTQNNPLLNESAQLYLFS